jgi:hypothetical protein
LRFGIHRTELALVPSDGFIGVDRNHQSITKTLGVLQQIHMPGVQQIERTAGEANAHAFCALLRYPQIRRF